MTFIPIMTQDEYINSIYQMAQDANMQGIRGRKLIRIFWNEKDDCVSLEFTDCDGLVIAEEPDYQETIRKI